MTAVDRDHLKLQISRFEDALEHLKQCQALWKENWSYGTDGSDILVDMQNSAFRLYQDASNIRAWLHQSMLSWEWVAFVQVLT